MANTDAVVGNRVVARGRVIARRVRDGRPEVILAITGGNGNRNNKLAFTYEHQIGNFAFGDEVVVEGYVRAFFFSERTWASERVRNYAQYFVATKLTKVNSVLMENFGVESVAANTGTGRSNGQSLSYSRHQLNVFLKGEIARIETIHRDITSRGRNLKATFVTLFVKIPSPAFAGDNYVVSVQLNGGSRVYQALQANGEFTLRKGDKVAIAALVSTFERQAGNEVNFFQSIVVDDMAVLETSYVAPPKVEKTEEEANTTSDNAGDSAQNSSEDSEVVIPLNNGAQTTAQSAQPLEGEADVDVSEGESEDKNSEDNGVANSDSKADVQQAKTPVMEDEEDSPENTDGESSENHEGILPSSKTEEVFNEF